MSAKVAGVLNMLVFPQFGGFYGVAYSCLFGNESLFVFVVLVCVFFFCAGFAFVCFGFVFALLLDCCWCCSSFFFFSFCVFSCFCFFLGGGLFFCWVVTGQVRCAKGPPHLALNPPYFLLFFVLFLLAVLSLLLVEKPCFVPLKKAICVVHSSVFPFVSL